MIALRSREAGPDAEAGPTRSPSGDDEHYELELRRIFRTDWLVVAHLDQLRSPGEFLTFDIAGEPIVVVRGRDEVVRAFSRVCRHRYADVLADSRGVVSSGGCVEHFTCPYHMWTYRLDGSLITAVDFAGRASFEPSRFALRPIHLAVRAGFVLVNLGGTADPPPVSEAPDLDGWEVVAASEDGERPGNWKAATQDALSLVEEVAAAVTGSSAALDTAIVMRLPTGVLAAAEDVALWARILPAGPERHLMTVHVLAPAGTRSGGTPETAAVRTALAALPSHGSTGGGRAAPVPGARGARPRREELRRYLASRLQEACHG
jgi:nitrite reductase/ring-hydroxylating ferredoxin subunit